MAALTPIGPEDVERELANYLRIWTGILGTCLGWPESRVLEWAGTFLDGVDPASVLRQPPQNWVAGALVPIEFRDSLTPANRGWLRWDIQVAMDQGDDRWDPKSPEELGEARDRIEAVFAKYRLL